MHSFLNNICNFYYAFYIKMIRSLNIIELLTILLYIIIKESVWLRMIGYLKFEIQKLLFLFKIDRKSNIKKLIGMKWDLEECASPFEKLSLIKGRVLIYRCNLIDLHVILNILLTYTSAFQRKKKKEKEIHLFKKIHCNFVVGSPPPPPFPTCHFSLPKMFKTL